MNIIDLNKEEVVKHIKNNFFNKSGKIIFKQNQDKILNYVKQQTEFLNINVNYKERFYCFLNNINELQVCKFCNENKVLKFGRFCEGYNKTCNSKKCKNLSKRKKLELFYNEIIYSNKNENLNKEEVINFVKDNFFNKNGKLKTFKQIVNIKNYKKNLIFLNNYVSFLSKYNSLSEKIYCFLNNIKEIQICKYCDKKNILKFKGFKYGYTNFCSSKCSTLFFDEKEQILQNKTNIDITLIYLKTKIQEIIKENDFSSLSLIIKKKYIYLYSAIFFYTKFLNDKKISISFLERIYCILNDISYIVKCQNCNNNFVNFDNLKKGYCYTCKDCKSYASKKAMQTMKNTFDENGISLATRTILKGVKTKKNTINEHGENIFDISSKKSVLTRINKIDDNGFNVFQRQSERLSEKIKNGLTVLENWHKNNSNNNIYYKDTKIFCQGSGEINFIKFLDKINLLEFVKRGEKIKYFSPKTNRFHNYFPDFELFCNKNIFEIKNGWTYDNFGKDLQIRKINNSKVKAALENGKKIFFVWEKNIITVPNLIDLENLEINLHPISYNKKFNLSKEFLLTNTINNLIKENSNV
jgi:hypothetical protein